MAQVFQAGVNFGASKSALTTISGRIYYPNGTTASSLVSGASIINTGSGSYNAEFSVPDEFDHGYIVWIPGDGSGNLGGSVNLRDMNVTLIIQGGGAYPVTLTLVDQMATPVVGAQVTVRPNGLATTVAGPLPTNGSGIVTFNLNAGAYDIYVTSTPGYATLAAQDLTVDGAESATYVLTKHVVTAPATPNVCRVYGWTITPAGTVLKGVELLFKSPGGPLKASGAIVAVQDTIRALSDGVGYFAADLVRSDAYTALGTGNTRYQLVAPALGVNKTFETPAAATSDITALLWS